MLMLIGDDLLCGWVPLLIWWHRLVTALDSICGDLFVLCGQLLLVFDSFFWVVKFRLLALL